MVDATSTSLMPRLLHVLLILPCHHLASSFSLLHSLSTQSKAGVCNVYGEDADLLNTSTECRVYKNLGLTLGLPRAVQLAIQSMLQDSFTLCKPTSCHFNLVNVSQPLRPGEVVRCRIPPTLPLLTFLVQVPLDAQAIYRCVPILLNSLDQHSSFLVVHFAHDQLGLESSGLDTH
jgi:hypothetical protein